MFVILSAYLLVNGNLGGSVVVAQDIQIKITGNADATAKEFIEKEIAPLFVCCEDSCFMELCSGPEKNLGWKRCSSLRPQFIEFKGTNVEVKVHILQLTEADKLNGVEWAGNFEVKAGRVSRKYRYKDKWTKWYEEDVKIRIDPAQKKKDSWNFKAYISPDFYIPNKGFTCSDIPK